MSKERGFTLIELLVTISVAAILLGVGVPSLQELVKTNRRAATANALVSSIQHARSTSAARGVRVVVCHSIDGSACSGAADPDWSSGWLSFADDDKDSIRDANETLLTVEAARRGVTMPSTRGMFVFSPSFGIWTAAGTVAVCVNGENNDRWITVSLTGRPAIAESGDVDC